MKNTSSLLFRQKRLAYRTSKKKSDNTFTNMRHNQSTEGSKRAELWTGIVLFVYITEEDSVQNRDWGPLSFKMGVKTIWWAPRVITAESDTAYIAVSPWNPWSPNKSSRIGTGIRQRRESTKICDRIFGVPYALRSRHSHIKEEDKRNVLVWCWNKQAITAHTGSPRSPCVIVKKTEEEVGHTAVEILSVLQKYSRPVITQWG